MADFQSKATNLAAKHNMLPRFPAEMLHPVIAVTHATDTELVSCKNSLISCQVTGPINSKIFKKIWCFSCWKKLKRRKSKRIGLCWWRKANFPSPLWWRFRRALGTCKLWDGEATAKTRWHKTLQLVDSLVITCFVRLPGDMFSSLSGRKSFQHVSAQTVHEISNSSHTALKYRYTAHDSLCRWHHVTVRGQRHVSDVIRHTCYCSPHQNPFFSKSADQLWSELAAFLMILVSMSHGLLKVEVHGSTVPVLSCSLVLGGGRNMPKHRTFH